MDKHASGSVAKLEAMDEDDDDLAEVPVPVEELERVREVQRLVSSVYRHVEHQQAVDQVVGLHPKAESSEEGRDESRPKFPSLPHSAVGSEGSGSLALQLHFSGTGSTESGEAAGRTEGTEDLLTLPPSLDTALRLNLALQASFKDKVQTLESVLQNNLAKQKKLTADIQESNLFPGDHEDRSDNGGKPSLKISYFCVPYFKNRSGMNAPKNEDGKYKVDNGYLDLYTTRTRPWLVSERERLETVVYREWKEQKVSVWQAKLRELQRKERNLRSEKENTEQVDTADVLLQEIDEVTKCIETLEKTPPQNIRPKPWAKMDWEKIAAQAFDGHRSSEECQLQWENLLHPSINRKSWEEEEDVKLQSMVVSCGNKTPDWEAIAKALKTNRTVFQVMQRWVSFIEPTINPAKWDAAATQKLIDTVNMLRIGSHIPWAQVHQHMVGFSRSQLQSRWRLIDPEVSKGPFTVEEDFILIKGLHMFGLNFANICHFMPGRNVVQVRERYKRTVLPGIAHKPWTESEDDILIQQCQVGPRNWRKMICDLPRRDACQIRCRYHVIQVWQTITNSNMVPPPLFPVSMTVDPGQVDSIRRHMIAESSNIKELVDISRKGIDMKSAVKELELRRLMIKARKANRSLEKMKKVTERRGRKVGDSNPHRKTIEDLLMVDFFVPYRNYPTDFSFCMDSIRPELVQLCKMFQLRILTEVTPAEQEMARKLHLTDWDLSFVHQMIMKHNHQDLADSTSECKVCMPDAAEGVPLLPPSRTTLGTFWSLLLHRPKLEEMSKGEFVFSRASKTDLVKLANHPKLNKIKPGKIPNISLLFQDVSKGSSSADAEGSRKSTLDLVTAQSGPPGPPGVLNMRWEGVLDPKPGPSGLQPSGETSEIDSQEESEAEASSDVQNQDKSRSPMKIHVTSLPSYTSCGRRRKIKSLRVEDRRKKVTYSRGSNKQDTPTTAAAAAADQAGPARVNAVVKRKVGDPGSIGGVELTLTKEEERPAKKLSPEKEAARQRSDNLLFQRMLSLFYWPAMMTVVDPPHFRIRQVSAKLSEAKYMTQTPAVKTPSQEKSKKTMLTKDELDIQAQEEYIKQLAEKDKQYHIWMNYQKSLRASASLSAGDKPLSAVTVKVENNESEGAKPEPNTGQGRGRGSGRARGRPKGSGRVHGQGRGRPRTHRRKEIPPLPSSPPSVNLETAERKGVQVFRRRQNLTSLRRSLVMKKIWEGRRVGSLPPRTCNRDKRLYEPRASRTRDSVRKELLRPPKETKIWDLPLDGPMKVRPQVPLDETVLQKIPQIKGCLKTQGPDQPVASTSGENMRNGSKDNDSKDFPESSAVVCL